MSMIDSTGSPQSRPRRTRGEGWTKSMALTTLLLALTLEAVALGAMMFSIALPSILQEFPTDQGGWLASAYYLAGAVAAPLLGKCADLYGKKRILLITMAISGVGTVICVLAPSFGVLILGRVFQGVILATMALTYSLIRDIPTQARGFRGEPHRLGWLVSRGRSPRTFLLLGVVLYGVVAILLATLHDTQGMLTSGIVYGIEGFQTWLYGSAGVVAILFLLMVTVLRPRPGEAQTLEQQAATAAAVKVESDPTLIVDRG